MPYRGRPHSRAPLSPTFQSSRLGQMASAGLAGDRRAWTMKQERRTPGYTTCWTDMPVARA